NGPPLIDTFNSILPDEAEDMVHTYRKHNLANHAKYVRSFPYVREVIEELQIKNVKMAIVSTKLRSSIQLGLSDPGLDDLFTARIGLDDVNQAKPHPESIHIATERIGADNETTLMVGDNQHGIQAGQKAGVQTAGVAWSMKRRAFLQ